MRNLRHLSVLAALGLSLLGWMPLSAVPEAWAVDEAERARLDALRRGTVAERVEALGWLAENGHQSGVGAIVTSLRDSDEGVRRLAESTLWVIWSRSGIERVDEMLKFGGYLMANGRLWQAVAIFDEVVSEMPDFAEGYNKRATAWYLLGKYQYSLKDIQLTLERNPYHFGALSGAGYCMIRLEKMQEALGYLKRALKINPNLKGVEELATGIERGLVRKAI